MIVRRLARSMVSSVFISEGVESFRHPEPRAAKAQPVVNRLADATESVAASLKDVLGTGHPIQVSRDPEAYVRLNAAVMTVAALLLSAGKLPRLSSAVLAGSLVPTTLAGHRFWEVKDPAERAAQRRHFLKNVGLIGGLILATVDTEGRPGLSWRVHHAADDTRRQVRRARKVARVSAKAAAHATRDLGSHLPG